MSDVPGDLHGSLAEHLHAMGEATGFSGVAQVSVDGEAAVELARGLADRSNARPIGLATRFAIASGTKGLTALTVMSLIEQHKLSLDTTVSSIVGDSLPLVDQAVTVEHLLTHRSGIGDYLDEELLGDIDDHVLDGRSAHLFERVSDYVPLLAGHAQRTPPGEAFAYNNSGFVVLALLIEAVCGSYHQAVSDHVLQPAGMGRSGFFRSDDLPTDCALGYLQNGRTNQFHLPVLGGGDGGLFTTVADVDALWTALFEGRIVSPATVQQMVSVVTDRGDQAAYGQGFWMTSDASLVWLEGMDAGVSFETGVHHESQVRYCVMSNTSSGVWPLAKAIRHWVAEQ
jgi:CubicO group peptidase (beta-lactamase class C family)